MGTCASRRGDQGDEVLGLSRATYANTKPHLPRFLVGKVVKVYDGDTVWVASDAGTRHSCRLHGIDCPELRSSCAGEREAARAARDCLANELLPKDGVVGVRVLSADKYGRLLVRLSTAECRDLSQELLSRGHAVEYDGGTKRRWTARV